MKKRLLSGLLTVALALVSVLAAGETVQAGSGQKYTDAGSLTELGPTQDDTTGNTIGIDVQAKVTGVGDIVYSVTVEWGAMIFAYDYGSKWDPVNHKYISENGNTQDGGWNMTYLDGTNNKITVTNDSNYPVNVDFAYTNTAAFNPSGTTVSSVNGIFDLDNGDLKTKVAATPINTNNLSAPTLSLNTVKDNLAPGEKYYYQGTDDGKHSKDIYFSLIGKPDRGIDLRTLQSVGTIDVTITPADRAAMATKS